MEAVAAAFDRNFAERGELGASLSVWRHGQEIISLHRGARTREEVETWNAETLVPVWSATKGPAALTFLLILHDAGLNLEDRVGSGRDCAGSKPTGAPVAETAPTCTDVVAAT